MRKGGFRHGRKYRELIIAEEVASNGEYTLVVQLPQDNPLGNDGEPAKAFNRMQDDIRDFDAFFMMT